MRERERERERQKLARTGRSYGSPRSFTMTLSLSVSPHYLSLTSHASGSLSSTHGRGPKIFPLKKSGWANESVGYETKVVCCFLGLSSCGCFFCLRGGVGCFCF